MVQAYSATGIFTGEGFVDGLAVIVEDQLVKEVVPQHQVGEGIPVKHFKDCILYPAFVDVQVYGAEGRLLSVDPTEETLSVMANSFASAGTALFQPTVATNTTDVIKSCIDAVRAFKQSGGKGVHGLHIEGPWIHPARKGAHKEEWIRVPSIEEVKALLDYGSENITMITLAPEVCSVEIIEYIQSAGIVVSAGHTDADFETAMRSFDSGIDAVTHLFNAMSSMHHRAPGLPAAAFLHSTVKASIIPDGHHVDYNMLIIAKMKMGARLFAITDAVTSTATGPYQHVLNVDRYECNGTLSGSALSMNQAFNNLVKQAGIEKGEAHRMCSLYPAQLLGADKQYGRIAPGYSGSLLVFNQQSEFITALT
ncbi:MAG: N-acetylglucosamine-6-phosphate deacetylase [Flavisolibacter sp.]|jgi:N-acetylglucosamine-6-phosphate deacetylase|nr:N-acetylglucosamine-6-phosphate deacetylase [Flavisolibacter sp.]